MSIRIGRRRVDRRVVPCVVGDDNVVRDASARVTDWTGDTLDPEFLVTLEDGLAADAHRWPPLAPSERGVEVPFTGGRNLVCVGQNFRAHAAEAAMETPAEPVVYLKPLYTLTPSGTPVRLPASCHRVTWEGELAVVIGRAAHLLADPAQATSVIAGFTTSNDLGDCDWLLHRGGQWVKGKAFPGFNPVGPWLRVGRDCHPDPGATLTTTVNGQVVQRARLQHMLWQPTYLVWYISQFLCLAPGDVVSCGTPGGTALLNGGYLTPGDQVEVDIEGLGSQHTTMLAADRTAETVPRQAAR